ncbi:MAG TPA: hypothetical protein VI259_19205, partial [Gemmatimonadaceae bacterium]
MSRALALVDSSDESRKNAKPEAARALLDTKLHVPRSPAGLVARPRLLESLQQADARRLAIVVAPAGFGKTTLVADWLAAKDSWGGRTLGSATRPAPVGWVSLDASDNDPTLFWAYFIRAVQAIHPAAGARAMALLQSESQAVETMLTTLINEIGAIDADFVVVLDDYHVIEASSIHVALAYLLDHQPPRLHLVITTRTDPPLPLPRLRARGELTELRAADLRFTRDEVSTFLNGAMGLGLSESDAATLEGRTEGWIAGLKLAALSMKGRDDVRGFVDAFSGQHRHIADYLVEEVLRSEPEHIRRFLLATAILDRMNGSLADAVTGAKEGESQSLLEELERKNLFVVALDDRREWYRYHHLFADVLQKLSVLDDASAARSFHSRASSWYDAHGTSGDAVRHALAAEDFERAAELLERSFPEKDRSYQSATWLARVKSLPDALVRHRPVLSMGYAWALLNSGELDAAEPRLADVARWISIVESGQSGGDEMVVTDRQRFSTLSAELASARVYLAQSRGTGSSSLDDARRALDLVPESDLVGRTTATALVALAHYGCGDLEAAYGTFTEALASMRATGHELDAIRGTFVLADIRVAQGRLREGVSIYEDGLRMAAAKPGSETDELYLGLSEVHCEWNDLASAERLLETTARSTAQAAYTANKERWCVAAARLSVARGDFDAAVSLLSQAMQHERRTPLPQIRPLPAMVARVRLLQGRANEANEWARRVNIPTNEVLGYAREFEQITLARLLVARHRAEGDGQSANDAVALLERLRIAAQTGGRIASVIEIAVVHALAQQALGNLRGAVELLSRALTLAEPEGFLRVFLDEGDRMREVLKHAIARGLAGEYTRRVLVAFDAPKAPVATPAAGVPDANAALLTPLTT